MTTKDAVARFSDQNRPEVLRPFLKRARLIGEATVGCLWGVAFFSFLSEVGPSLGRTYILALIILCVAAWYVGQATGPHYFRIRKVKAACRFYRLIGVHRFRRWMLDGDLMNARLRQSVPGYRVVSPHAQDLVAYVERTKQIEKAHWIWFLLSVPFIVVALANARWLYATGVSILTLVTNIYPVFLQRFNRARCQVLLGSPAFTKGAPSPSPLKYRTY